MHQIPLGRDIKMRNTVVRKKAGKNKSVERKYMIIGFCFLLPAVIVYLLFMGYPLYRTFALSLTNWSGFGDAPFTGLANFQSMLSAVRELGVPIPPEMIIEASDWSFKDELLEKLKTPPVQPQGIPQGAEPSVDLPLGAGAGNELADQAVADVIQGV